MVPPERVLAQTGVFYFHMPYDANKNELEILKFWEDNKIFEKSVSSRSEKKPYVFYDGPPFATGLPHYGHIVASLMKDVVPRYFTMQGKRVERVWGWDCHGLPIENIVEKELGTKTKKEIEAMGVAKFNELCRSKVLGYVGDWKKTVNRLGRWVDMENAYKTMDLPYMESVWWVFKQLWDKGLVYEDYRSMHVCPRCETTLSQQEVSEGYKDVKDISVYVKFRVKNVESGILNLEPKTPVYLVAWTTTPWTLPGNVAVAVGKDIVYAVVTIEGEEGAFVLAKERLNVMKDKKYEIKKELKGSELVDLEYEPLFDYYSNDATLKNRENGWKVYTADFVTVDTGTGIAHEAPAFGADDWELAKQVNLPFVQHVSQDGRMKPEVTAFAGLEVKPRSEDDKVRLGTDIAVIRYLQEHGQFFAKENIVHSYPHCWRCDTPLLNYATSSWFVKVTGVKDKALKLAKKINWSPEHIKEGRFGMWLEGARDWSVSRQRFWASVMPVWKCEGCKEFQVFGSVTDLEKVSGKKIDDLHKHIVDEVTFPCATCKSTMRRVPDVLDTWFDSGSMPYAQVHYPFENKKKFEQSFPAEFIAEGQDQTRAWFYYLHVLGTALFNKPAFENVIVNGIVLAEDGKKMSKKLQNYPDPNVILEKYGADALRYYLVTSPVMHAESLNFSETGVREMFNKVVNTLSNVVEFYGMYVTEGTRYKIQDTKTANVLDKWILAKLQLLIREVTEHMEKYELSEASRPLADFIGELSTWYVRRSRDRFKGEDEVDKQAAIETLGYVLLTLTKVMAPFTPFLAEKVYQDVKGVSESVHLEAWPKLNKKLLDENVLKDMEMVRKVVEMGLALRAEAGIKVRQILGEFSIRDQKFSEAFEQIIRDELNVKRIVGHVEMSTSWITKDEGEFKVALNREITPELQKEGLVREIVRTINGIRKEKGLTMHDKIVVGYATEDDLLKSVFTEYADEIKKGVLASEIKITSTGEEKDVDGRKLFLDIMA